MQYYIQVIKNYTNFKGRARRKEYWMFTLFHLIFGIIAMIIDNTMGITFTNPGTGLTMGYGYIYLFYGLFALLPGFAVLVRRLHDIGKSGRLLLFVFIASIVFSLAVYFITKIGGSAIASILIMLFFLGICIWFIVMLCKDSTPGPNKYGPNPKGIGNVDDFDFMSMPDANR